MKLDAIVAILAELVTPPHWWSLRTTSGGITTVLIQGRDLEVSETIHTAEIRWTRAALRNRTDRAIAAEVADAVRTLEAMR